MHVLAKSMKVCFDDISSMDERKSVECAEMQQVHFSEYKTKVIPNKVYIIRLYTIKDCIIISSH